MQAAHENKTTRRVAGTILVVLTIVAWRRREQIKDFLGPLFESIEGLGIWAPIVLALLYIPACLMFVPNTFISPGVGFLLGPVWGTLTAIIGLTIGATSNFLVSRSFGRSWFAGRCQAQPQYRAIELACQRDGLKVVTLTRLTPAFPSNLMSYLFGMTGVSCRDYAIGTAIGLLPRTLIYTTIGAAAKSFADASTHSIEDQPIVRYALYVGIAVTLVVLAIITKIAKRALDEALQQQEAGVEQAANRVALPEPQPLTGNAA